MNLKLLITGSKTGDIKSNYPVSDSPLAPCPDSPNCIRVSRRSDRDPDKLFADTENALKSAGAESVNPDSERLSIDAIFRIPLFGFRDDVTIKIEKDENSTILHIRSASRVGHGDLGVNARRVQKLLNLLKI